MDLLAGIVGEQDGEDPGSSYHRSIQQAKSGVSHILDILRVQNRSWQMSHATDEPVLLEGVISDLRALSSPSLDKWGIEFYVKIGRLPLLPLPRNQLLQALLNLIKNSKEAIVENYQSGALHQGEGEILLSLAVLDQDDPLHARLQVEIVDNGVGIEQHQLERVMEMGYSTKVEGSGIGLHSIGNLVQRLQGELVINSSGVGLGTAVSITLPVTVG